MRWLLPLPLLLLLMGAAPPPETPAPGPLRIIGNQSAGCIAGAVRLPDTATGLQTIRLSRSSFWGSPATIAALQRLAAQVQAAGLPDLYMGDISGPRGGPLAGGHFSHQMGIDADVWLDIAPPHPLLQPADREAIDRRRGELCGEAEAHIAGLLGSGDGGARHPSARVPRYGAAFRIFDHHGGAGRRHAGAVAPGAFRWRSPSPPCRGCAARRRDAGARPSCRPRGRCSGGGFFPAGGRAAGRWTWR